MAKRLNKKVALIGSVVLLVFVVIAVAAILHLSRSPEYFLKDAEAALAENDLETAERSFLRAKARARDDQMRVDILFRLIKVLLEENKWPETRGCWAEIIRVDPENIMARYAQLENYYIIADGGVLGFWDRVETQASELLEIVQDSNLLLADTARWELPIYENVDLTHDKLAGADGIQRMGPFLYILKGRATVEMVNAGAVTEPDESIAVAISDLKKAQELDPTNITAAWYLAQALVAKARILASRGSAEEPQALREEAVHVVDEAAQQAPNNPDAQINLLVMKQMSGLYGGVDHSDRLVELEGEFSNLMERFPNEPRTYIVFSGFCRSRGKDYIDEAIGAIDKARQLDPENVRYALGAADLYYVDFSLNHDRTNLAKALQICKSALELPGAKETVGPRQLQNRGNRTSLYTVLAVMQIEPLLEYPQMFTDTQRQQRLSEAEATVHQIEQLLGSGEHPVVAKWQALLELAKGNRGPALQRLYTLYQRLKAANRTDRQLAYFLAEAYKDTPELGAAAEFFVKAMGIDTRPRPEDRIDRRKPAALLDYADVVLKLRLPARAIDATRYYEETYGANTESKALLIRALLTAGNFDEAEKELAQAELDEISQAKLTSNLLRRRIGALVRSAESEQVSADINEPGQLPPAQAASAEVKQQLASYYSTLTDLTEKLLALEPNSVGRLLVLALCQYHKHEGRIEKAAELADKFLQQFPDDVGVRTYLETVNEPNVLPAEQLAQIQEKVASRLSDPVKKALNLGSLYQSQGKTDQALAEFGKLLSPYLEEDVVQPTGPDANQLPDTVRLATARVFELAIQTEDWALAEKVADLAARMDLDECQGEFIRARLFWAQQKPTQALEHIDAALRLRPVFGHGFAFRAEVNRALGKREQSLEDIKTAAHFNPLDGDIRRAHAAALYHRNRELGDNVTAEQLAEAKQALRLALATNPKDLNLQRFYAEYISGEDPNQALAIQQRLYNATPNLHNALLYGNLALRIANQTEDPQRKEALFEIARAALEKAEELDPNDSSVISSLANYYDQIGQPEKVEPLFDRAQDPNLRWQHYYVLGQFQKAKPIIEQLHQEQPDNVNLIRALLSIAEHARNAEEVRTLAQELVEVENTLESELVQVQSLLNAGLTSEADTKLQSLIERYPDEPRAKLFRAGVLMRTGQLEKALEMANQSLETDETSYHAWYFRGQINRLLGDYAQAIVDLNKSKSIKDEPRTRIALARAYLASNRQQDAALELAGIVEEPQTPDEARLLLESTYSQMGNTAALRRFYANTIRMFPDSVMWAFRAASFTFSQGDYDQAAMLSRYAFAKSVELGQPSVYALDAYLNSLLEGGELDELLKQGQKYVDTDFAAVVLVRMAQARLRTGDQAGAFDYYRKAFEKSETNPAAVSSVLGPMQTDLGREQAETLFKQKLEADPNSLGANYGLFLLARTNAEYNKAVDYIAKAVQIAGPDTAQGLDLSIESATALMVAYQEYSDNSYLHQAIGALESLQAKWPDNGAVLNNLAYLLAENDQDLSRALEYAAKALEGAPDNPGLMDTYAYVLCKNGRFKEAAQYANAALQQYELNRAQAPAEVYAHLGLIMEKLGRLEEAREACRKALELGKDQMSERKVEQLNDTLERLSN